MFEKFAYPLFLADFRTIGRIVKLCTGFAAIVEDFLLTSSPLMLPTIALTSLSEISLHSKSKSRIENVRSRDSSFLYKRAEHIESSLSWISLGYLWPILLVALCCELMNLLHRAKPDRRKKTRRRGRSGSLKGFLDDQPTRSTPGLLSCWETEFSTHLFIRNLMIFGSFRTNVKTLSNFYSKEI